MMRGGAKNLVGSFRPSLFGSPGGVVLTISKHGAGLGSCGSSPPRVVRWRVACLCPVLRLFLRLLLSLLVWGLRCAAVRFGLPLIVPSFKDRWGLVLFSLLWLRRLPAVLRL